jgi:hypothetical protein
LARQAFGLEPAAYEDPDADTDTDTDEDES